MNRNRILITAAIISVLLHFLLLYQSSDLWNTWLKQNMTQNTPRSKMMVVRRPKPKEKMETEKPKPDEQGQIVELAKPEDDSKPVEADYLAEDDHRVEEETASKNFTVNPEIIAPTYSEEQQVQYEDALDVNATEHSSGVKVGNDKFKPSRDGRLFSFPSPYTKTNKDGLQKPPWQHRPANDCLEPQAMIF